MCQNSVNLFFFLVLFRFVFFSPGWLKYKVMLIVSAISRRLFLVSSCISAAQLSLVEVWERLLGLTDWKTGKDTEPS